MAGLGGCRHNFGGDDIADDINGFLVDFNHNKHQTGPQYGGGYGQPPHSAPTHDYSMELPTLSKTRPGPLSSDFHSIRSYKSSSTRTGTSQPSITFDIHHRRSRCRSVSPASTETRAPDLNEISPDEFQAFHPTNIPQGRSYRLPCEFSVYTGCMETFGSDEVHLWIEHTVEHFGSAGLPAACLCWYCDVWKFIASDLSDGDRRLNLQNRMLHITDHLVEAAGNRMPHTRLDPWVLDHLWRNNLISKSVFEGEKARHEAPQIEGLIPAGAMGSRQKQRNERNDRVEHDMHKEERRRRKGQPKQGAHPSRHVGRLL